MLVVVASRFHTTSNTGIDSIETRRPRAAGRRRCGAAFAARCWPRVCRVPASGPMPARSSFLVLNGWLRIAVLRSDFDGVATASRVAAPLRSRGGGGTRRYGWTTRSRRAAPGETPIGACISPDDRQGAAVPAVGGVRPRPSSLMATASVGATENGASHPSTKTFSPARVDNGEPGVHGRYATALVDASPVD